MRLKIKEYQMTGLSKGFFIALVFLFCVSTGVFAQAAVLEELAGTVEIKYSGSNIWESAVKGQTLNADTMISTGFKSTALIRAGSSVITVRPLTRLSLSELISAAGTETLNVSLQTGRVRVEVKPPAGAKASMNVTAPTATASVRGTVFEFDTINLFVQEGTVQFSSGASGVPVLVDAGKGSFVSENGRVAIPEETAVAELKPDLPVGTEAALPVTQIQSEKTAENITELEAIITF
jgi:hypothetical protein